MFGSCVIASARSLTAPQDFSLEGLIVTLTANRCEQSVNAVKRHDYDRLKCFGTQTLLLTWRGIPIE